jgi:hypothetical protein
MLKERFVSLMSNEGVQGLLIGNDVIDFASDAFLYHTVVVDFAHLNALFISFTVFFALACCVSGVGLFLKIGALVAQLRIRKRELTQFALHHDSKMGAGAIDRKTELTNRLGQCKKDIMHTYA